jgi:hypothetical protein
MLIIIDVAYKRKEEVKAVKCVLRSKDSTVL